MILDLEFVGFKEIENSITVDGKFIKLNKNKDKTYSCSVETNNSSCEVVIQKAHYYSGKNWFWWNLLYFVVSFFGLFDIRQNKRFLVLDSRFTIEITKDTKAVIQRQDFEDGGKLLTVETDSKVEEFSNIQYYDKEARKKHSKMKKFKIGAIIVAIALVALVVVL